MPELLSADTVGVIVIHGVNDVDAGRNLENLTDTMAAVDGDGAFPVTSNLAEVYSLDNATADELSSSKQDEFEVRVKTTRTAGGTRVRLAEMYWADTNRVSRDGITALREFFKLVFELQHFLHALIAVGGSGTRARIGTALSGCLHLAAYFIRGPIAGFQFITITVGLALCYWHSIAAVVDQNGVAIAQPTKTNALVVLAIAGLGTFAWFGLSRTKASLAWLEALLWVGIWAVFLFLMTLMLPHKATIADWTLLAVQWLDYVWWFASVAVFLAGVLVLILIADTARSYGRSHAIVRNHRPLLAFVAVILMGVFVATMSSIGMQTLIVWVRVLGGGTDMLAGVFSVLLANIAVLIALAMIGTYLMRQRKNEARSIKPTNLSESAQRIPRLLVASHLLVTAAVLGFVGHFVKFTDNLSLFAELNFLPQWATVFVATVFALGIGMFVMSRHFATMLHVGGDLVDHQYTQQKLNISRSLLPKSRRGSPDFPRRWPLQGRLSAVRRLLEQQGCNRFVYVAHSQGTVIMFEHLQELPTQALANSAVVTFGSPLNHIYAHYFHEYDGTLAECERMVREGLHWENFYRIDDPIGGAIGGDRSRIINHAMFKGIAGCRFSGHTRYFEEDAVARAILEAITTAAPPLALNAQKTMAPVA